MMDWVSQQFQDYTALATFFTIFAAGMVFVLFSLIFGGDHDHGDVHTDHGDSSHEEQGPSMFSVRGISLMAVGFGGFAFIVMYFTKQVFVSSIGGLGFGWVFALVGISLMRGLIRQQSNSVIKPEELQGVLGEVTTSIPANGLGEVRLTVHGSSMTKTANSVGGKAIPSGQAVRVVRALGGNVLVDELN